MKVYILLVPLFLYVSLANTKEIEKEYDKLSKYEDIESIKKAIKLYKENSELYAFLLFRYALKSENSDISLTSFKKIEKIYKQEKKARILSYLGATKTLIARDSINPITKTIYTIKGVNLIREAKKKSPNDIIIRIVSGLTMISIPSFFGFKEEGIKDLMYVVKAYETKKINIGEHTISSIYYTLAKYYKNEGKIEKAKDYFFKCSRFNTKYTKKCKFFLE